MAIITRAGFDFGFDPSACNGCAGHCCCGESGNIWVRQQEIVEIAAELQINIIDCIQQYCNRVGNRLAIKEQHFEHGLVCVFFAGTARRCTIYRVRPEQCRRFPFWEYFKKRREQLSRECPGIRELSDAVAEVKGGAQ